MTTQEDFIRMPLSELITPRAGRICYSGAWWAVDDNDNVLFYKTYDSPQCNTEQELVKRMRPECKVVWVEISFIPHNCYV